MKKTRFLSLLLVACMLLAAMSACGSTASTTESAAAATDATETAAATESAAAAETPAEASPDVSAAITSYDLPLFDPSEDVRFSMWVSFSDNMSTFMPNGFSDNHGYIEAAKETGVNIDFVEASTTSNSEKFNIMIASGDFPDVITNISQLWTTSYESAIEDNIFIDLTDMVNNYMPVYKGLYDQLDDSVKKDLHTDSGYFPKLTSINYYSTGASEGAFIRTDYLKKVGMDVPVTYDDLHKVLTAFKDELGISQPLMLPAGIVHTSNSLCSGYDVNGGFSTFPMVSEPYYLVDGKVHYGIIEDGYKQYMEMIAQYYQEGLIDPDFITKNTNPMGDDFIGTITSGEAGIFFGETNLIPNYIEPGKSINPDFDITCLPEIVQTVGQTTHFGTVISPISGRVANIVVTSACDDLEKLGKYLDFFFTQDGALLASMGVEGDGYVWNGDKLAYSDTFLNSTLGENEKPTLFVYSVVPQLTPETPSKYTYDLQDEAAGIWDSNTDTSYQMPTNISMTTQESEDYSHIYTDIQTYIEENLSKFAVGATPMSEWDNFVATVKSMGIDQCIAYKQAAVDRYNQRAA